MQTIYFASLLDLVGFTPEERKRYLLVNEGDYLEEGDTIATAKEGTIDNTSPVLARVFGVTRGREWTVRAPYKCVIQGIDPEKGTITIDRLL